jgi:hypothetical protein
MKKKVTITITLLAVALLATGCGAGGDDFTLPVPAKVRIGVSGRQVTVSWRQARNAQGYEIITTSEGCGSGNRKADTREGTAILTSNGDEATNVEFIGKTSIRITLMASDEDPNVPMASSVTAKVMSLGGTASGNVYLSSDYSEIVSKTIDKFIPTGNFLERYGSQIAIVVFCMAGILTIIVAIDIIKRWRKPKNAD